MCDLVKWAREQATGPMSHNPQHAEVCDKLTQLADEIERLRAENAELRKFRDGLVGDYIQDGRVVYMRGE